MKITTTKNKVVDTDKLSDRDAELHLAVKSFYDVCKKYNAMMFCRVVLNDEKYCGAQYFGDRKPSKFDFLFDLIGDFVNRLSSGGIAMFRIKPEDDE